MEKRPYLCLIPARGGSKGVPDKNIKELNGKPLIQYSIDIAKDLFDKPDICVSTDSDNIKKVAEGLGVVVPFMRPDKFSTDTASSRDVILHAIAYYESINIQYSSIVLLQPTSPFRRRGHVSEATQLFTEDLDMVVSVKKTKANPYFILFEENDNGLLEKSKKGDFQRRQDIPEVFELNGSIYVINTRSLKSKQMSEFSRIKKYVMAGKYSFDIDTRLDWQICEAMMKTVFLKK